jgi:glycolate oxidase iron-sulfur subunit
MKHEIDAEKLGPLGAPMAAAVRACVHCGFCLSACPTYEVLKEEMDSPRGRIVLMKQVLEGTLGLEEAAPHLDRCLGCLACEPACPSGVPYHQLISPFRAVTEPGRKRSVGERLKRFMLSSSLPDPARFRRAASLGRLSRPLAWLAPKELRPMLDLVPDRLPPARRLPSVAPARGEQRARVALLGGCAQQALDPEINSATVEVLTRNGVEVVIPAGQGCCGALDWHAGNLRQARRFARINLTAFPQDVDAVISNASGCGTALREYPLILRGTDQAEAARAFAARVQDVSEFLHELGPVDIPEAKQPTKVIYQDACHLKSALGIEAAPRALLRAMKQVDLVELPNPHRCCGSAGTYNIDQPEIAAELGRRKAADIIAAGADVLVSGNIGCLTQLRKHLAAHDHPPDILHLMVFIARALSNGV